VKISVTVNPVCTDSSSRPSVESENDAPVSLFLIFCQARSRADRMSLLKLSNLRIGPAVIAARSDTDRLHIASRIIIAPTDERDLG
jgi:hypothetical protein